MLAHLAAHPARLGATRLLCVDGAAGSGKTTLCREVVAALGTPDQVAVVHLDDLYRGWDDLAATPQRVATQVLAPLAQGRPGRYRRWDWHTSSLAEEHVVAPTPHLIVEGVGAAARVLGRWATTLVWLDLGARLRRDRALARDGDVFAPHWERWATQEERLYAVEQPWLRADLVLATG